MSQSEQHAKGVSTRALLSQLITFQIASEDYEFRRFLLPHIKANKSYADEAGTKKIYCDN
jgi:hypothetical protein